MLDRTVDEASRICPAQRAVSHEGLARIVAAENSSCPISKPFLARIVINIPRILAFLLVTTHDIGSISLDNLQNSSQQPPISVFPLRTFPKYTGMNDPLSDCGQVQAGLESCGDLGGPSLAAGSMLNEESGDGSARRIHLDLHVFVGGPSYGFVSLNEPFTLTSAWFQTLTKEARGPTSHTGIAAFIAQHRNDGNQSQPGREVQMSVNFIPASYLTLMPDVSFHTTGSVPASFHELPQQTHLLESLSSFWSRWVHPILTFHLLGVEIQAPSSCSRCRPRRELQAFILPAAYNATEHPVLEIRMAANTPHGYRSITEYIPRDDQTDAIFRAAAYHRKDYCRSVIWFAPREHVVVRPSLATPFYRRSNTGLGSLDRLPLELLHDVILHLDMRSLSSYHQLHTSYTLLGPLVCIQAAHKRNCESSFVMELLT
ncbi:uncharacterized protein CLUP02_16973 [Colletotrichum lupini]|uniref:F-box domain-containing protein n=1 Tax=Colletotrichum lupini TaxID=145971 RepID=A0A9Q8T8X4_9PEZI|nr:uncharacterized protein CLUP02_16973 [Colletotrichum lupini]UQC91438.1 hypothetical protein CLUP02_16973 [Colletotrichum lupini]